MTLYLQSIINLKCLCPLISDDYAAKWENRIFAEIEQILFLVPILRTYSGR